MTKEEPFTLSTLYAFTSTDFEQYRERGEAFRLRLSNAVISCLALPDCWRVDCECRQEWGGQYPVHLHLSHQGAPQVVVELISPCHASPYWYARLDGGELVAWVYSRDGFDPESLRATLALLGQYISSGFTDVAPLLTPYVREG